MPISQDAVRAQLGRVVEKAIVDGEYDAVDWILRMWYEHSTISLYDDK